MLRRIRTDLGFDFGKAIARRTHKEPVRLSPGQEALWHLHEVDGSGAAYHIHAVFDLSGALNSDRLAKAISSLAHRHEILRTRFPLTASGPMQVVEHSAPALKILAISPDKLRVHVIEEIERPFDIQTTVPVRWTLFEQGPERHTLVVVMHHLAGDAWSQRILVEQLSAHYAAGGDAGDQFTPAIQYQDYSVWVHEQERFQAGTLASWVEHLQGAPSGAALPYERPRPAARSFRSGHLTLTLEASTADTLHSLASQQGATLFHVLLAGVQTILHRLGGTDEAVVGTPLAGRSHPATHQSIGYFVNTLALRGDMSGNPTFAQLVRRAKDVTFDALARADVPFGRIVEALGIERKFSETPLFHILLNLQSTPPGTLQLPGIVAEEQTFSTGGAKYDLTIDVIDHSDHIEFIFEYAADLFEDNSMEAWGKLLLHLFKTVALDSDLTLSRIALLDDVEVKELIAAEYGPPAGPANQSIIQAFLECNAAQPGQVAIRQDAFALTYSEVEERSARLAGLLISRGVGEGDRVAVRMDRSINYLITLLAIWRSGAVWVPIESEHPSERTVGILREAQAALIIVDREASGDNHLPAEVLHWREDDLTHYAAPPASMHRPDDLAYIMFTSGSTGQPKGVMVPHNALGNYLHNAAKRFNAHSGGAHLSSPAFDLAITNMLAPLVSGGCCEIIPTGIEGLSERLLAGQRFGFLSMTTSHLRMLVALIGPDGAPGGAATLVLGAETVLPEDVQHWMDCCGPSVVINEYGPTETTVGCSYFFATTAERQDQPLRAGPNGTVPIGQSIGGMAMHVVDSEGRPVPPGATGRLIIGGQGLAWGYLNRPRLTAERFLPNPLVPGGRIYDSGDIVRRLADGALEFIGRADRQLKLAGYRIEPGEIESCALTYPGVAACHVGVRRDRLVAWVVAPLSIDSLEIAAHLDRHLPRYMIPVAIIRMEQLPLTTGGKLDVNALDWDDETTKSPPAQPDASQEISSDHLVTQISEAWAQALGGRPIGPNEDVFGVGADSLSALKAFAALRDEHPKLKLRQLFTHRSPTALAAAISELGNNGQLALRQPGVSIQNGQFRASSAQKRLWLLSRMYPDDTSYHVASALRFHGKLDYLALETALKGVAARHDLLNSVILDTDDDDIAIKLVEQPLPFEIAAEPMSKAAADTWLKEQVERRFSLTNGPLWRVAIRQMNHDEHQLVLVMHHIITDGWSVEVMLGELIELYCSVVSGQQANLPQVGRSYFERTEEEIYQGSDPAQKEFWKDNLRDVPFALDLPTDAPRPDVQSFTGDAFTTALQVDLLAKLRHLALVQGVTLNIVILAAFATLLSRLSGQSDFCIGLPASGRTHARDMQSVGLYVNVLPLRLRPQAELTFDQFLQQVSEATYSAIEHQAYPIDRIIADIGPARDAARHPLYQVMFNGLGGHPKSVELPDLQIELVPVADETSKLDLTLYVSEPDGGCEIRLVYNSKLYSRLRIGVLAIQLVSLLEQVTTESSFRIADYRLETNTSTSFNGNLEVEPRKLLDHLEAALAAFSTRPALVQGEKVIDYGELNCRSDQLARAMLAQCKHSNDPVAIVTERDWRITVAMLACARAGLPFCIVDATYPAVYLAARLETARPSLILNLSPSQGGKLPSGTWNADETPGLEADYHPERTSAIPLERLDDNGVAYISFTSGSTRQPSGVVAPWSAIDVFADWYLKESALKPQDNCAVWSTIGHDPLLRDALVPLAAGSCIRYPAATLYDPNDMAAWLGSQEITILNTNISRLRSLPADTLRQASHLRLLLLGGERLERSILRPLLEGCTNLTVMNVYGATETPQIIAYGVVEKAAEGSCTLTHAVLGTEIRMLSRSGIPAGVGEVAEIVIGGQGVACGYWDDPRETALRFLPDENRRVYHTGDLGRLEPDGTISVLGRQDDELNIRGHRIQAAEVAGWLTTLDGINEAFVASETGHGGEPILMAWVAVTRGDIDSSLVARQVRDILPPHLRPSRFVICESLPRLLGGKVDAKSLRQLAESAKNPASRRARGIEQRLATVFEACLGIIDVGPDDDFFALGGHSLLAPRLCAKIHREFDVELTLVDVFREPGVACMAATIERRITSHSRSTEEDAALTVDPAGRHLPFPLTDIQQAYWVGRAGNFEINGTGAHVYFEIDSPQLDIERFQRAWDRLVERHDMLRAVILPAGEQQVLPNPVTYKIVVYDLKGLTPEKTEGRLNELRKAFESKQRDPEVWPLFEVAVSQRDGDMSRVHISISLIVCDAWSIGVLERDLAAFYRDPDRIYEPLDVTFRDYLLSDTKRIGTAAYTKARAYWEARLDNFPSGPDLPLAADPASLMPARFERIRRSVDAALWTRAKAAIQTAGLTPTGFVLTAFTEALARHSQNNTFLVTLTLFNRLPVHPHIADVVGDFTSTSLFETPALARQSFSQLARLVQEQLWSDLDNRSFNGIEVVRAATRRKGGARTWSPLVFTSLLGLGEGMAPDDRLPGSVVYRSGETPQVWLDNIVFEQDGALVLEWNIVEGLFPSGFILGLQEMFVSRLEELAGLDDWNVPLLSRLPSGQAEVRDQVNATAIDHTMQRLEKGFLDWSAQSPEHLAIADDRGKVSYGDLRQQAASVATALAQSKPGSLVGVVMDRGREQAAGVLGTLWAGHAYLPATTDLPPARLAELMADGGVETVLTQSWLVDTLIWPEGLRLIAVDRLEPVKAEPEMHEATQALAYVIYTSGSTGRPKGVAITHAAAWNTIADINTRFAITAQDRVLAVSALSFDLSVWDLFGLLSSGGAVILPAPAERPDPAGWLAAMAHHTVTVWNSAPALMEIALAEAGVHSAGLSGLRLVMVSGDWVAVDLAQRLHQHAANARVIALGGATEAAIWSNFKDLAELSGTERSVPYGRPLANQHFHVLDATGRPRPDWVAGELYIAGAGLAEGYWGDAERTAERFVQHPQTGERLYRTGDMGRYLPGGDLEFLGRQDNQVKVQGHRIELAEIEAALQSHPLVGQAVATAPGPRNQRRLVGYVTGSDPACPPDEAALRHHLGEHLPRYMVPGRILVLERLPLTANGKVDRQALPADAPATFMVNADAETMSPLTARLAASWGEVLGHAQVGEADNFFHLGGDSMLAARIVVKLREQEGLSISIRTLFENPTPNALANAINKKEKQTNKINNNPTQRRHGRIEIAPRSGEFPATSVQESIFLAERVADDDSLYVVPLALKILGPLDGKALEKAACHLVRRHEALRTGFEWREDRLVQIVQADAVPLFEFEDADVCAETGQSEFINDIIAIEAAKPLRIDVPPLVRFRLLRLDREQSLLLATFHHLAVDGTSFQILMRDLDAFYRLESGTETDIPPAPAIQFADFATYQAQQRSADAGDQEVEYWRNELIGLPNTLELPFDYPLSSTYIGRWVASEIEPAAAATAQKLAASQGQSLFAIMLSAWEVTLARFGGVDDLAVAIPMHGRTEDELQDVVGCFANTVLIRANMESDPSFAELMGQVTRRLLDGGEHQGVPIERVFQALNVNRVDGRMAIAPTNFVMPNNHGMKTNIGDCHVEFIPAEESRARYDLTLAVAVDDTGWMARLKYNAGLFRQATAEIIIREFTAILSDGLAHPERSVSQLARNTYQSQKVSIAANTLTVSDQICKMAAKAPQAVAIKAGSVLLSRAELENRANRIAHRLRAAHCGPETIVGVSLGPCADLASVMLGIWRAGAAYLPIDDTTPDNRARVMLSDANVSLLITDDRTDLAEGNLRTLSPQDLLQQVPEQDTCLPTINPRSLAYVIYTSGSTGRPKGVQIEHRQLSNYLSGIWDRHPELKIDSFAVVQSPAVDFGITTFWGGLAHGATIHMIRDLATDPEAFGDYMASHGIAGLKITPSHLNSLLQSSTRPQDVLPASVLMLGGESSTWDEIERYRSHHPDLKILNHYGPTEATVGALTTNLNTIEPGQRVPLGTPLPGTTVVVLDRHMEPVPIGAVGEICIGGFSPARGYLGQGATTARSFVPDPCASLPGGRLYRTGDLARLRSDGLIEFLGRADQQVKIRGYRVETMEVETLLHRGAGVKHAVTQLFRRDGREIFAAYVIVDPALFDSQVVLNHLRAHLPEYMVPAALIVLDALPMLPNGKLDRMRLPQPDGSIQRVGHIAPRTDAERIVAAMFQKVLGIAPGVTDSFFELGGHSLSAMQLLTALRDGFGVSLPMVALFKHPTVEALALKVGQRAPSDRRFIGEVVVKPDPDARFEPFPMTDIQQAFWLGRSASFEIGNISAHAYWEFDATGIDLDKFGQVFQRLIDRHDMLRAIVLPTGELQVQENVPPFQIGVTDARGLAAGAADDLITTLGKKMEAEVFDLGRWPLFDMQAVLLDEDRIRLFISFDIIIGDAWSFIVLLRELSELYIEPARDLSPLPFTFRDYIQAVQRSKSGEEYQRAKAYWLDRLETLPAAPKVPFAVDPSSITDPVFIRTRLEVDKERWSKLKALAANVQATPSALVMAAFAEALSLHAESGHFVIDLTLFNRTPVDPAINSIVGDFTSVTLLEVDVNTAPSFEQLIRAVQERLWSDLDNRAFSGIEVMRAKTAQQGGVQYLVPVVFTSIFGSEAMREDISPTDLPIKLVRREGQTPQAWIDHMVVEEQGRLLSVWNIVEGLFPSGFILGLQEMFVSRLEELAGLDDWNVPLLSRLPSGQAEVRDQVNATAIDHTMQRLEKGFLDWSAQSPEHLAIADDRGKVSYGDLRQQAASVATALAQSKPGSLVGVVMDRGREQAAGVLGTLWAGHAYLPATTDLPPARLAELMADGGVETVLTQSWLVDTLIWPEGLRLIAVDRLEPVKAEPEMHEATQALAYVIYTSGSTGRPKGVAITHAAAWNTIADINTRFAITAQDRVLAVSALSFDLSVWDLFGLLSSGGAVILPAPAERPDPAGWLAAMAHHTVTVWNSAPALMEIALAEAGVHSAGLSGLRLVMVSGDWVAVDLAQRLHQHAANARVIALGGATEAAIWSNFKDLAELSGTERSVPYGRPLANQHFHVLDATGRPRPDWVAGELYIAGAGLAEGYWGDAERTAERFVQHPQTGERLYRTGDMGRYLPGGDLEFLGRQDNQVKVQGHRIELAEIEAALQSHPLVGQAVATAPGPRNQRRLVGYVTGSDPACPPDEAALRHHLGEHLPRYMVPGRILVLERLPLTANGKVDRQALPADAPATFMVNADAETMSPLTARLAASWGEVLGHAQVGEADNFFHLGGDSMLAARIVVKLREQEGLSISIRTLFENPTPNALANAINKKEKQTNKAVNNEVTTLDWHKLAETSDVADLMGKADFAIAGHNLRSFSDTPAIDLNLVAAPLSVAEQDIRARHNSRRFASGAIPQNRLSSLLSALRAVPGETTLKYGYASAGGLYPVQVYLTVHRTAENSRITGLAAGSYYYNPMTNSLCLIQEDAAIPTTAYGDFNRAAAANAAFTVLLVADMAAIMPVYGTESFRFAFIEAGLMTQLLEMQATRLGLGIGHIGSLGLTDHRGVFALSESHVLVHTLVGGILADENGARSEANWTEELL